MRNLQFDILSLRDQYKSLKHFKASFGWIGKMKRRVLKPAPKSIVKEVAAPKLLAWLQKREKNPLASLVTTDQVRAKFKSIFGSKPSRYALKMFRECNGIQIVFDAQTKNTNSWVFES